MSSPARKLLYISSFQFSGSTLLSFLLNLHSRMASIGHATGWRYGPDEDFRCSCGQRLPDCALFKTMPEAFRQAGLPFDFRHFGTKFELAGNERLDRYLLASLPFVQSTRLEAWRDRLIGLIPAARRTLARELCANEVMMSRVLAHLGAEVFVDNTHDPYRLRWLRLLNDFQLFNVHLVRDPRGVAWSSRKNSGLTPEVAVRLWLRRQADILRISPELPATLRIYYEELCTDADAALARIHRFAGLEPEAFPGDFKSKEHHILGNQMRLGTGGVKLDTRWREELPGQTQRQIEDLCRSYARSNPASPVVATIRHYFPSL
jgi:hypothetical protein